MNRQQRLLALEANPHFDAVILGGGINGACTYDALCRLGYRVLLVDRGDFSSGTSQSSGMMIWGGLLYLRNFDFASVLQLSQDRERMIRERPAEITSTTMRYVPARHDGRPRWWVHGGLWLYWLLGRGRRSIPRSAPAFAEAGLLKPGLSRGSLTYEEAFLSHSDARFVLDWLAPHQSAAQVALNYCEVTGECDGAGRRWHLSLNDLIGGGRWALTASMMINCTGVWTDRVNAAFAIESPFRHVLSKGVYLGLPRQPAHRSSLFFDLGEHGDVITHVPWGPVSLWGPTETAVSDIDAGLRASDEDIDFLLDQYAHRYRKPVSRSDIVSLRCGIRPLVVDKQYRQDRYPLDLSRRQEVVADSARPWISCYGGKLTGCARMAARVAGLVSKRLAPAPGLPSRAGSGTGSADGPVRPETRAFPGLQDAVTDAGWSAEHEACCTLDDYLRRRTNIAQWLPRGGLGQQDSHAPALKDIALQLSGGDAAVAEKMFDRYSLQVKNEFDVLMRSR